MPDSLTFTPTTGTPPASVRLDDYDLGEADVAGIIKKHAGYGPKVLKIGSLDGSTHLFTVALVASTKTAAEALLETWKNLKWQPGAVAYELAGASGTITPCTLISVAKASEFPAVASVAQSAQYIAHLAFLETAA